MSTSNGASSARPSTSGKRLPLLKLVCVALVLLAFSQAARGAEQAGSSPAGNPQPAGRSAPSAPYLPGVVPLFSGAVEPPLPASDVPLDGHLDQQHLQNLNVLRAAAQQCQRRTQAQGGLRGDRRPPPAGAAGDEPLMAQSTWVLGLLQLHGKAGVLDRQSAAEAFNLAWRCGYPLASAGLAWCAIEGCAGAVSVDDALQWTDRLLRVRPGRALYLRWFLYQRLSPLGNKRGAGAPHDRAFMDQADPAQWLRQAAAMKDAQANNELGIAAFETGALQEAIARFAAAASESDAARFNLGVAQARQQWLTLSAPDSPATLRAQDNPASRQVSDALRLAVRYHRGDGVPVNFPEALRYYRMAADLGSQEARRVLSLVYSRLLPDGRIDVEWMSQLSRLPLLTVAGEPARFLQRDPSAVYDLLPLFWRR